MSEEVSSNVEKSETEVVLDNLLHSQKRSNRMILIGAPAWVKRIIHLMHVARITEVRDWSPLTPTRHANEVISLMQRPKVEE